MPAKIITLSQKDQDLLRYALTLAVEYERNNADIERGAGFSDDGLTQFGANADRIKDLKERLV